MSEFGRTCCENVIKRCRALSCRYPVNCIVMRTERYGSFANPAPQRHDRSAETGGQAKEAGGKTAKARSVGRHGCISPDSAGANHSNANACARFSHGEARRA